MNPSDMILLPPTGAFLFGRFSCRPGTGGPPFHVSGFLLRINLSPAIEVSKFDRIANAKGRMPVLGCRARRVP